MTSVGQKRARSPSSPASARPRSALRSAIVDRCAPRRAAAGRWPRRARRRRRRPARRLSLDAHRRNPTGEPRYASAAIRTPAKIWRRWGKSQLRKVARGDARTRRPRAAAQHPVAAAEEHLGVLAVGVGDEPGIAAEAAAGPLPDVADHAQAPARRGAGGIARRRARSAGRAGRRSRGRRARAARRPTGSARGARPLIPGRRLLPLGLGRQAGAVRAGEGVGLEPGDVDHGPAGCERRQRPSRHSAAQVRGPALRVG